MPHHEPHLTFLHQGGGARRSTGPTDPPPATLTTPSLSFDAHHTKKTAFELVAQHRFAAARSFVVLTCEGVQRLTKRRPLDELIEACVVQIACMVTVAGRPLTSVESNGSWMVPTQGGRDGRVQVLYVCE